MAFTGKNPRFTSTIYTDALATTPSSPPSGSHKLIDRNGQLFLMDSAGAETPVGGGAGEKNYILAPSTTVGWTASGAGITIANDTTVAELPRGLTTKTGIKITGVSGSTAYAYYRFTLDQADYNRKLKVKFDLRPISGYVANDMKVDVYSNTLANYSGTSTRIATSSDVSAISAIANATGQFETTVDMPGSSAPYMELRIGLNATSTQAIVISDVVVGPGLQPQGAVITSPLSFTPTGSWSANTTYTGNYTRVGNNALFSVKVATSGAPTSAALTINMPSGLTIDTTALTDTGAGLGSLLSSGEASDSGTSYKCSVKYSSTSAVAVAYQSNASGAESNVTQAAPFTFGASDYVDVKFMVPIAEWAGSGTVNIQQGAVEYAANSSGTSADDTTSFIYGPAGSTVTSQSAPGAATIKKRVRFKTPIQTTDQIVLEIKVDNIWIPITSKLRNSSGTDITQPLISEAAGPSVYYGIGWAAVASSTTDIDVLIGQYRTNGGSTFGAVGAGWGSLGSSDWGGWRLKKFSGAQAVGFGLAAVGTSGLINYYYEDDTTLAAVTFAGNLGGAASASIAVKVTRVGRVVTVEVPTLITVSPTTSSVSLLAATALPTWARPSSTKSAVINSYNNGAYVNTTLGCVDIATDGLIRVYRDIARTTAYTNSANAGWAYFTMTYSI